MVNKKVMIPDLGGVNEVTVLEILVNIGDAVEHDQAIMSLESEKASMDVPSEHNGHVVELLVKPGDRVQEGDPFMILEMAQENGETSAENAQMGSASEAIDEKPAEFNHAGTEVVTEKSIQNKETEHLPEKNVKITAVSAQKNQAGHATSCYASPTVRRMARQLGIDIQAIPGTGQSGRVSIDDVIATVQSRLQQREPVESTAWIDPSKFGPCEEKNLGKIKKATAKAMSQSWANVVHVTQCDKTDITQLEQFRCDHKEQLKTHSVRLTMLAFIIKALAPTLKNHPHLNASYREQQQKLWVKHYYHIGFAVDTPNGLVVPVIKDVDRLSVIDIAKQLGELSQKARDGKLTPKDMTGASFTVSSLGGLGGTYFTPIVNQPQSAILGISRAEHQPVWDGKNFQPRLMLPLSLSYDHRVIDGAEAMRFLNDYSKQLTELDTRPLESID